MALRQRLVASSGQIRYEVTFRHNGKQRQKAFATERAQLQFHKNIERFGVDKALAILERHTGTNAKVPTLHGWIVTRNKRKSGITEGTRTHNLKMADRLAKTYPIFDMPIDQLEKEDIEDWIREQELNELSSKTIKNQHSLVSDALNAAVPKWVASNVARGVKIGETIRDEMVILSPAEFEILYNRIPEKYGTYRALTRLLFASGARIGEATALQPADLRLDEKPATFSIIRAWKHTGGDGYKIGPPKTRQGRRTVSIPKLIADDLLPLCEGKRKDDWLFTNLRGKPVRQGSFWEMWQRWIDDDRYPDDAPKLGKKPRIHDLRHSHASYMIGKGMNLLDLQRRLGHKDINTTANVYGHLLPESQVMAARLAESMFEVEQGQARKIAA